MAGIASMLLAGLFNSCSSSPDSLSSRTIVKLFNEQLEENAENKYFTDIKIGVYECNDPEARAQLRYLEAAGLITYSVERYAWWEKSLKPVREAYTVTHGYWYTYTTTEYRWVRKTAYDFEDHYVVNINLTSKGKRLVVEERPLPKPEVDKDMVQPEIDVMDYEWNKKDLTEAWPEIENPFIEKRESQPAKTQEAYTEDDGGKEELHDATPLANSNKEDGVDRIDASRYEAFNALSLESETVIMKACEISATKARNIRIGKDENGFTFAEAEVITETCNVTDVGRIFEEVENGLKVSQYVSLEYYNDKGWTLKSK